MLESGRMLNDRYEIIEQVGSGGMSIVYKAKCHKLGRFVAVKVLRTEFCHDADFIRRFKVEAQAAASLSHPNIVNVYDVGNDDQVHYIVMEFLQGVTLKEYIENYGPLTEAEIIKIALSVASALDHAHTNRIIHRDIKPQNIIISAENQIKVMDFGIARVSVTGATIDLSNKNVAGSVHYISPEQAKGNITDEQSDIYSLGITMYEMATKTLPYEGDSAVSIAVLHINQQIPNPIDTNQYLSQGINSIILKAANSKKELRYPTAKALSADLRKLAMNPSEFTMDNKTPTNPTIILSQSDVQVINQQTTIAGVKSNKITKADRMKSLYIATGAVALAAVIVTIGVLIALSVMKGTLPKAVTVANFEGQTLDESIAQIELAGLKYTIKEEIYSEEYAPQTIISQQPKQTSIVEPGTMIELVVSKGEELFEIPYVEKLQYKKAQTMLEEAELDYVVNLQYSDSIPVGIVMSQNPAAGEMAEKGKAVELVVSNGPEIKMTTVPQVQNLNVESAKVKLAEADLVVGEITFVNDELIEKDLVISQSVNADKEVEVNTSVNLVISLGKKEMPTVQITVPNIFFYEQVEGIIKVVLINNGVETIIFEQNVLVESFPLTFDLQGEGMGTVDVYLDGFKDSTMEINFDVGTIQ